MHLNKADSCNVVIAKFDIFYVYIDIRWINII